MSLLEVCLETLFTLILAHVADVEDARGVINVVNKQLVEHPFIVPENIGKSLDNSFASSFVSLQGRTLDAINRAGGVEKLPQLQYLDTTYRSYVGSEGPRCLCGLIFTNKVNEKLMSPILQICDEALNGLEYIGLTIYVLRPGVNLSPHRGSYAGFVRYVVVLYCGEKSVITVAGTDYQLQEKSSLFYNPLATMSISNGGKQTLIFLSIDIYRPFENTDDILNYVAIRAIKETSEVEHAFNLAAVE